ncbi:MAG: flagellar assembly protein FliX [Proteobacteria bacterium]|nr:flagellar assembly protein FliX [Pseudomonadota bacterium]
MRGAMASQGGGFRVVDGAGVRAAMPLPAAVMALPVAGLKVARPRAAIRGGRRLLDGLDKLRLAVLGGGSVAEAAAALRASADLPDLADDEPPPDGALRDLLDAIRLRADVELAKLAPRR